MLVVVAIVAILLVALFAWYWNDLEINAAAKQFPGPAGYPIVGNALQFGTNTTDISENIKKLAQEYVGKTIKVWMLGRLIIVVLAADDAEILLSSNTLLNKSEQYNYLQPWLGTGLLTSTGAKWRKNRKILTPTFHFKILEEFVEVFENNSQLLVEALEERVGGPAFDIHKYISLHTLDNICETAMGVKINALQGGESEYVKAIRDQSQIIMTRSFNPWYGSEFILGLSSYKSQHDKSLKILHDFTNGVIKSRRAEMTTARKAANGSAGVTSEDGVKRRLAFLDLLIESTLNGSELTDENIREEVDTFMFEGHDTTAAAISFAFWELAWNQDIQDRVLKELEEVWPDPSEPISFRALQELKYMERVIKEVLRMYPSVPFFGREASEDITLNGGLVVPKGVTLILVPIVIQRDPALFPDPDKFDPDRFLPENVQGRNPFAYTPFSAGPRNCIGQKFAMLEIKSSLAKVLRSYKILPGQAEYELQLLAELIITSKNGVPVKIERR